MDNNLTNKNRISSDITKREIIIGAVLLAVHSLLLPLGLSMLSVGAGIISDESDLNLVYYGVSFSLTLMFLWGFLKREFYALSQKVFSSLFAIIIGYLIMSILSAFVYYIQSALTDTELANPNTEQVVADAELGAKQIIAAAVILGPIVEETLFRGVIFGSIRRKNRLAAYAVSFALFSVYHLWQYIVVGTDSNVWLSALDYLPASIALAYVYERSGNLWSAIFLHSFVNLSSLAYYLSL